MPLGRVRPGSREVAASSGSSQILQQWCGRAIRGFAIRHRIVASQSVGDDTSWPPGFTVTGLSCSMLSAHHHTLLARIPMVEDGLQRSNVVDTSAFTAHLLGVNVMLCCFSRFYRASYCLVVFSVCSLSVSCVKNASVLRPCETCAFLFYLWPFAVRCTFLLHVSTSRFFAFSTNASSWSPHISVVFN